MFLIISLFLLFWSRIVIGEESDNFCKTEATKYSAFNLGHYLIIQTHSKGNDSKFWAYMLFDNYLNQVYAEDFKQGEFLIIYSR